MGAGERSVNNCRVLPAERFIYQLLWHTAAMVASQLDSQVALRIDLLDRIDWLKLWISDKTKSSNCKDGMEDIHHVAWAICNAAQLGILSELNRSLQRRRCTLPDTAE